jgi:hypothetical protein
MRRFVKMSCGLATRFLAGIIALLILGWPGASFSATNEAVDPGGGGLLLAPSGPVTVTSTRAELVKQARDLAGAVLPDGTNVSSGQVIYFVIYVDNGTVAAAGDVRITDLVNETQFTYIPNTLETTVVPSGSSDAAIWAGAWVSLTDAVGGPDDIASFTDTGGPAGLDRLTIGAVPGQANLTLDIPGGSLRAIRFRKTVN